MVQRTKRSAAQLLLKAAAHQCPMHRISTVLRINERWSLSVADLEPNTGTRLTAILLFLKKQTPAPRKGWGGYLWHCCWEFEITRLRPRGRRRIEASAHCASAQAL